MSTNPQHELSISALRAKTRDAASAASYRAATVVPGPVAESGGPLPVRVETPVSAAPAVDAWPFVDAVLRRWLLILLGALLLGAAGYGVGRRLWSTSYTAVAQLVRVDPTGTGDYRPREISAQSFASMVSAPALLRTVSQRAPVPISAAELAASLQVSVDREDQTVSVTLTRPDRESAVELANLVAEEAVHLNQTMQFREKLAAEWNRWQAELTTLLSRYTEAHPAVQQQRAKLAALEQQYEEPPARGTQNAIANYHLFSPATVPQAQAHAAQPKIVLLAVFGGFMGMAVVALLCLGAELLDGRLKTAGDLERATRLPVLGSLGNLKRMKDAARKNWAYGAWKALQDRLPVVGSGSAIVCGFTSSRVGEGRSTIINLLAQAAGQEGRRVLTIAVRPPLDGVKQNLPADVLAAPARITEILVGADPNASTAVAVSLHDGAWDADRYRRWREALHDWQLIPNVAILVELPPAAAPDAVMLAESLPHLVWIADARRAEAVETRAQLATLRHAHCRVAGAILNWAPARSVRERFTRWVGSPALAGFCLLASSTPARAQTGFAMAVHAPRMAWQQNLTIGPGDVLTITLHGEGEPLLREVFVGPDGRVNFFEAQDVVASGLTVDQLRGRLDAELARFRRAPRTTVSPVALRSKKYFVLGAVAQSGVFTLDRPVTIIEAVARARGLETGLVEQELVELADLSRSFLAREGRRLPVNLERLFREGDFTQNVGLAPGDYLFLAPAEAREVYVLGEVTNPGVLAHTPGVTAVGAVAGRGGFAPRAWSRRVLVIRGSLHRPEKFVVDVPSVLAAQARDLPLEPKDIVYVSARPWARAEELLEAAASSFVESAVTTWSGVKIGSAIRNGAR